MTTQSTTTKERFVKLSLHPADYSGKATEYHPHEIKTSELERTLTSNNYSPIIWRGNYRAEKNFAYATGFCLDIDQGKTISEVEAILHKHGLNYALITTRSHQSNAHRFRVFIPFNRKVCTLGQYRTAADTLDELLGTISDPAVFDGARQLFASPEGAYYSDCWSANDFNVSRFTGRSLSSAPHGTGDWDDNLIVKDKDGHDLSVRDIKQKTPICCPWHDDESPSAFIDFSEQSRNWYIHCSACSATFWKSKTPLSMDELGEDFWSHSSKIYEMGIIGDTYHFKEIGEKKFYAFTDARTSKEKEAAFNWLLMNHHIANIINIDYVGDPLASTHTYSVLPDEGRIEVKYTALPSAVEDNSFIEDFLQSTFGQHTAFIKQYMAVYAYTDFRKLPTLILTGKRGVGKSVFAEMLAEIYPQRSQFWTASEDTFNAELQKKLLIADETVTSQKKNYLYLKRISGQNAHVINEKFTPRYQVKNNVSVIILSNNLLPIFVEREEMPSSEANNQFFVFEIKPFTGALDARLGAKLKARLGHYVRTELKRVYDTLDLTKYRYSIPVPITQEEYKLFNSSVSLEQMNADKFLQEVVERSLGVACKGFIQMGYLPIDAICEDLKINARDKRSIVHNLREREYLAADETRRLMVDGNRQYCYLMTEKFKTKIETDNALTCVAQNAQGQQAMKAA